MNSEYLDARNQQILGILEQGLIDWYGIYEMEMLETILSLSEKFPDLHPKILDFQRAVLLARLGRLRILHGQPVKGNALVAQAIALAEEPMLQIPSRSQYIYHWQGNIAGVIEGYKEECRKKPDPAVLRTVLGRASYQAGDLEGAHQEYRIAIALQPNYTDALIGLGQVHCRWGKFLEGLQYLHAAVEENPGDHR